MQLLKKGSIKSSWSRINVCGQNEKECLSTSNHSSTFEAHQTTVSSPSCRKAVQVKKPGCLISCADWWVLFKHTIFMLVGKFAVPQIILNDVNSSLSSISLFFFVRAVFVNWLLWGIKVSSRKFINFHVNMLFAFVQLRRVRERERKKNG